MGSEWKTANELADEAFTLTTKGAVRFLLYLKKSGTVEATEQEWVDQKYRKRKRLLFRLVKENTDMIQMLSNIFGARVPYTTAKPQVHRIR